ncbi:hypothetical protein LIER_19821 [Lithospermum erythrorhizon]|uniref:Uncharacterized protein n=1 Tax=Lithospermum erythrorhizon TaxID=34254 RepID=A0AAV3QJ47_LITER
MHRASVFYEMALVPALAYERVEEKFQFSLIGKVLTTRRFNVRALKDSLKLEHLPSWVQIWNLRPGYIDAEFGRAIRAHIDEVIEVDKRSIEQERGRYLRVKVRLHVGKPLKRGGIVPLRHSKV